MPSAATEEKGYLPISQVRTDGGTQMRAAIDKNLVRDYASLIKEAWDEAGESNKTDLIEAFKPPLPPVVTFYDGQAYWLGDGFQRVEAYKSENIPVVPAEIRSGTREDAIYFATGANAKHGKSLSGDDRKRAIGVLLNSAVWGKMSDHAIAKHVGCARLYVAAARKELADSGQLAKVTSRTTVSGKTMNTAKIGAASKGRQKKKDAETAEMEAIANEPLPPDTGDVTDDDLTVEEFIESLPAWKHLSQQQNRGVLFAQDATNYLKLKVALGEFSRKAAMVYRKGVAPDTPFGDTVVALAQIPHPSEWKICSNHNCRGEGCDRCHYSGYSMHNGIEPAGYAETANENEEEETDPYEESEE